MLRKVKRKIKNLLGLNSKNIKFSEKHVQSIMKKTGWSRSKTIDTLLDARNRLGIKSKEYDLFNMHEEPKANQKKRYSMLKKKENNVRRVMEKTGWTRKRALGQIDSARKKYKISSSKYIDLKFYETTGRENSLKENSSNHVLILARDDIGSLGLIRALASTGYVVDLIACANRKGRFSFTKRSKFLNSYTEIIVKKYSKNHNYEVLKSLLTFADGYNGRVPLIVADEFSAKIVCDFYDGLKNIFQIAISIEEKYMQKDEQLRAAKEVGFEVLSQEESGRGTQEIDKEVHLLEVFGLSLGDKVIVPMIIQDNKISSFKPKTVIEGEVYNSKQTNEIVKKTEDFIEKINYIGLFNIKLIQADKELIFDEIKFAPSRWNFFAYKCGANLAKILVQNILDGSYDLDDAKIINNYQKFVNDKALWREYINDDISRNEFNQLMNGRSVKLLLQDDDFIPGKEYFAWAEKKKTRETFKAQKEIDDSAAVKRKELISKKIQESTDEGKTITINHAQFDEKNAELKYDASLNRIDNIEKKKQPKPIIAACYYLGIPLPKNATLEYQPSVYVEEIDGSLEGIQKRIGFGLLPETEKVKNVYERFKKRYLSTSLKYTDTDLAIYFVDFMFFCTDYGYHINDYFNYEFCNKDFEIRETFMNKRFRDYIRKTCNQIYALPKVWFNDYFSDYVKRGYCNCNTATFQEFCDFLKNRKKVFAKPDDGTGGAGASVFDVEEKKDMRKFYKHCQDNKYVLEDIVEQHKDMARFNESTLNTVRVYSLVDKNGKADIKGAIARFGRSGQVADNFHKGGFVVGVNTDNGTIYTNGININGVFLEKHLDSGVKFKDEKIPEWEKLAKTICECAEKFEENKHVGWDVAITKDGDIELIEGNSWPNFDALQKIDMEGKFYKYDKDMEELAIQLGKPVYVKEYAKVDISNMEKGEIVWK